MAYLGCAHSVGGGFLWPCRADQKRNFSRVIQKLHPGLAGFSLFEG